MYCVQLPILEWVNILVFRPFLGNDSDHLELGDGIGIRRGLEEDIFVFKPCAKLKQKLPNIRRRPHDGPGRDTMTDSRPSL